MELQSMKKAFIEADHSGGMRSLRLTLPDVADICISEYKKKYGVDMMDSIKLAEEVTELITALSPITSGDVEHLSWRLSDKWFNLVEELEDVDIMVFIVNRVLNEQLGTTNEMYDEDIDFKRNSISYFIRRLGIMNQLVLKGVRKQFNPDTAEDGRKLVQRCLNEIYSLGIAIQCKFYIRTADINTMRYVKVARLLDKYGYNL